MYAYCIKKQHLHVCVYCMSIYTHVYIYNTTYAYIYTHMITHVDKTWMFRTVGRSVYQTFPGRPQCRRAKEPRYREMEVGWWAWVWYRKSSRWWYSPYEELNVSPQTVTSEQNILSFSAIFRLFRCSGKPLTTRDLSDQVGSRRRSLPAIRWNLQTWMLSLLRPCNCN